MLGLELGSASVSSSLVFLNIQHPIQLTFSYKVEKKSNWYLALVSEWLAWWTIAYYIIGIATMDIQPPRIFL